MEYIKLLSEPNHVALKFVLVQDDRLFWRLCWEHNFIDSGGNQCWNLSGPNLRPETNPRRLTASYPSVPYLIIIPTYHRTIPELSYYADVALRTLGGPLITYGTHA